MNWRTAATTLMYAAAAVAITDEQRRAICRIFVPGPDRIGTGFLVDPGHVLTAAHVVASEKDAKVKHAGQDIDLSFGNPTGAPVRVSGASVKRFDAKSDWALLALPAGMQSASPAFRGRPLPAGNASPWETFGHSRAADVGGQEYGGTVRTQSQRRFQLYVDQKHGSPAGLSGSPCLIDGEVVGIVLESQDLATPETLHAVSVTVVVEEGCVELSLAPAEVPYVDYVTYAIQGFTPLLPNTAVTLGLGASAAEVKAKIADDRLAFKVAEAMMGGIDPSLNAIRSLQKAFLAAGGAPPPGEPPARTAEILEYAAQVWIDGRAVRRLCQVLEKEGKLVALNVDDARIAGWYVHRAGCLQENPPGRFFRSSVLDLPTIQRDVLLDAFEETIAGVVQEARADLPDYLADSHPHEAEPIVVWLTSLPDRADLDWVRGLHKGYEKVRVIFMTGPEPPKLFAAQYPDVETITPNPLPERVAAALQEHDAGKSALYKIFKLKRHGQT